MVKTNIQTFTGEVEILSNLHLGDGSYYMTANADASNVIQVTGNVGATFFVGDGGFLSNIATTLSDIVDQGNTVSNVVQFSSDAGVADYKGVGIVTDSNVGIQNTSPDHTLAIGDKVRFDTNTNEALGQSVIQVDGRINATRFEGDGGLLSNIATTLQSIVDQGNVSANVVQFNSATDYAGAGIITRSNVGIQNTDPVFNLSVGSNLHVDDEGSNVLVVHGNVAASNLNLGAFTVSPSHDLDQVCAEGNTVTRPVRFSNVITGISAASNIESAGTFISTDAERGIDVASNIDIGGRLKFDSNVFIDTLRVADIAANIVTYDSSTGELLDSSGTFMNKFAVVSEQPPSDFFANTTTVANHGTYTLTTSNLATNSNTFNAFDGTANAWVSGGLEGGYIGGSNVFHEDNLTQLSNLHPTQFGDWLAIEFPYKTTLRHMKITPLTAAQFPASANVYATNNDLTWTEVKYWKDVVPASDTAVQTITVDATDQFKKYALVATKAAGNSSNVAIQDWQLFTESFSIDGGKVAMAQQAATGGETVMDQSGPHGRGTVPLKKYPEIIFEDGRFTYDADANTYMQAGYSVSTSNFLSPFAPYRVFDSITNDGNARWRTNGVYVNNLSTANPSALNPSLPQTQLDTNTSIGEYLTLKMPKKIKLKHVIVNAPHMHMPYEVDIYGRNEGVSTWTHVKNYIYSVPTRTTTTTWNTTKQDVDATEYYSEYAFVVVKTNGHDGAAIGELQLYGYEEDLPAGDISVDTTFTSIMNTPQTTGANVYVDGNLGETFTNRVVGPTVSNTHTTYVSAGKYWELSGNVESNVTVEANTFLSGDAPHSLSMWFKSSNLEANVSNSCIFSLNSGEEKLDYVADVRTDTYQTSQKIYGTDTAAGDRFGGGDGESCLAMTGDGSIVVVGAKYDESQTGAVYVFMKDANGYWNEVQKLTASDATATDRFGAGVDISSDGNYIAIGARLADGTTYLQTGQLYIFKKDVGANTWSEQLIISSPDQSANNIYFARRVSISSDGTYVVAAAQNDTTSGVTNGGAAYVYKRTGSTWNTTPYKIVTDDVAANDYIAGTVEISSDGNFIALGVERDDGVNADDDGSVYMFARTGDNTWTQQQKINNPNVSGIDNYFGGENHGVSISSDGTYIIAGAYGRDGESGAVFFFQRTGSSTSDWAWSLMGSMQTHPLGVTGRRFGRAVRMSPDGLTALVHARDDVGTVGGYGGAVFVYTRSGNTWTYKHRVLNKDRSDSDHFGSVLDISTDGSYFIAGMFRDDDLGSTAGAAYIFTRDTNHHYDTDLKLQANTWHNLTYAYQGEGGSRVTYLDGRKVVDETIEDTYGEYPPFAMDNYSQGGYVVTASSETNNSWLAWKAFDRVYGNNAWHTAAGYDTDSTGAHNAGVTLGGHLGHWIQLESPHKIKVSHFLLRGRDGSATQLPKGFKLIGSNSGIDDPDEWDLLFTVADASMENTKTKEFVVDSTKFYKFHALVFTHGESNQSVVVAEILYYGHRENDFIRLPDPVNVTKYPHVNINQTYKRGYTVSTSSEQVPPLTTGSYQAYNVFDGDLIFTGGQNRRPPNGSAWISHDNNYNSSGIATGASTTVSGVPTTGEWVQLELPHKVRLSYIRVMGPNNTQADLEARSPVDAVVAGSNNGTTWTSVLTYTGASWTTLGEFKSFPANVDSTNAYKYFRFIVTKKPASSTITYTSVQALEYFGTAENSQIPLQIGGGNIDRVANFRVYDRFIEEDQALEIWDAQKDEFGRAKSSMTLHKGRLGIGTTEPEGRLAVLDEPHIIEEFPPGAMSSAETHIKGHGVFRAWASRESASSQQAWEAFNKTNGSDVAFFWDSASTPMSGSVDQYSEATGRYIGTDETRTVDSDVIKGTYIQLEMPYKVKLSSFSISPQARANNDGNFYGGARMPETGSLVGSNDGVNWHLIGTIKESYYTEGLKNFKVNTTVYYSYFRLIAQSITSLSLPNTGSSGLANYSLYRNRFNLSGLVFFGVREQGQSTLHDGQLTLTKNLTVPQIGPVSEKYPTPRRHKLLIEYNTALMIHSGKPIDTSENSNDGNFNGNAAYDESQRAFRFDEDGDYVSPDSALGNPSGDWPHSFSFWFKTLSSSSGTFFSLGNESQDDSSTVRINSDREIRWFFYSNDVVYNLPDEHLFDTTGNTWSHLAGVYYGGVGAHRRRLWMNGYELKVDVGQTNSAVDTNPLTIPSNTSLHIGIRKSGANDFHGWISTFRLYDCALAPEEIYTLYRQGRLPPVHHLQLIDSTMTIGSHDRHTGAQLDVAGHIRAGSQTIHTFTGQHRCFPDEPMEKGLIVSAKKNKFVKLNGFATGQEAITIDESLPIVSLSNVAQDKACFGVVSSIEKSTPRRSQIVNGIISDTKKETGDNRAIVNSVGEGAIWVVNTNGSLESGDYITTSNVAGYGQKQDDDVLHNYTVAKITMDCDFTGSNVAVQTIKREQTGLRTITEDTWNELVDYDRSSNTETQYSNTLVPSAYSNLEVTDRSGYVPREVTTIVDYTDGSNLISIAEWSNLESNIQNTYQSNTFTEIVEYTKFVSLDEWSNLTIDVQNTYSEAEITTYYQIQRGENVLDENGQLQFEDKTGATETPYERRFLDASGAQTDEANAVHIAAFVGCTYHCG